MTQSRRFSFSSGSLCLDYANTCGDRPTCSEDLLSGIEDLAGWACEAGLLSDDELVGFNREGAESSRRVFDEAVALREAIYGACSALAAGSVPSRPDIAKLNDAMRRAMPNLELGIRGEGCCWEWADASSVIERIMWPIARSAADLLTSDEARSLRECAGAGCSWLFLDRSRNGRRKWCSMSSCGNRAKARRHYARKTSIR